MKNITEKWMSLAKYDLESAEVMLKAEKYLYVAFMCQQSVEKHLKAYLTESHSSPPPYTHNLNVLAELTKIDFAESELELLSLLTRYYINARYPGVKEKLSKTINKSIATNLFNNAKEIIRCLKKELKMLTR
ncbi:MAG: HEPN domain-containing protein [Pseudomonadota bacterium]